MIQKKWFSIEHLKDGYLGEVKEVEAKGRNGSVIRFYEANDKADACSQAKQWWEGRKRYARDSSKNRAARLEEAGVCLNGSRHGPRLAGRRICASCAETKRRSARKNHAKRSAGDITDGRLSQTSVVERFAHHTERIARNHRSEYVRGGGMNGRYLRKLDELSPGEAPAFRRWLTEGIGRFNARHSKSEPLAQAAE